ncbi:MAG: hypothetical protein AABZ77_06680 [Chloroflexota bacterium]
METIRGLLTRFRQMGLLLFIGFIVIVYISLGVIYWQQTKQQTTLGTQIAQQSVVLSRPLASGEELKANYEAVRSALVSVNVSTTSGANKTLTLTDKDDAVELLVLLAEKSGISVNEGKIIIDSPSVSPTQVGGNTLQLVSFRAVRVQGDNGNVMAFLSDLDSGKTLGSMVLKRMTISYVEIPFTENETEQRDEFNAVTLAVKNMMADNGLSKIPKPLSFALGRAANFMGDDLTTNTTMEGFPDNTTTITEKGYTVNISGGNTTSGNTTNKFILPRNGYVLYQHDKIPADNTSTFKTVSYISTLKTKYYYTVEADGTIRQFSGPNVSTAVEYSSQKPQRVETVATIDVDIYAIEPAKK